MHWCPDLTKYERLFTLKLQNCKYFHTTIGSRERLIICKTHFYSMFQFSRKRKAVCTLYKLENFSYCRHTNNNQRIPAHQTDCNVTSLPLMAFDSACYLPLLLIRRPFQSEIIQFFSVKCQILTTCLKLKWREFN